MLILCFTLVGVLLIVIQTTFFSAFPAWLGRPDLVYILVTFAAYRFDWLRGLFLVFFLGWMMDVVSGIYVGTYPLEYILVYGALKGVTVNSPLRESTYQVPLVGLSYFVVQMVFYFAYSVTLPEALPEWSWNRTVQETLILIVATIPCFVVFNSLYEYLMKKMNSRRLRRRSVNHFR